MFKIEETTIIILFGLVIAIGIGSFVFSYLNSSSLQSQNQQINQAIKGVNKNISTIGSTASNQINNSINKFSSASTNTLNLLNKTNTNLIGSEANNTKVVLSKMSDLSTQIAQVNAQDGTLVPILTSSSNSINSNIVQLSTGFNKTLQTQLANIVIKNNNSLPLNTITIWNRTQNVLINKWLVNQMLSAFIMHINVSATNAITLSVMNIGQYANFTTGNSFTAVQTYTSSGASNNIKFNFNLSTGCGAYVYAIKSSTVNSPFTIHTNVTGTYSPSLTTTGICNN